MLHIEELLKGNPTTTVVQAANIYDNRKLAQRLLRNLWVTQSSILLHMAAL